MRWFSPFFFFAVGFVFFHRQPHAKGAAFQEALASRGFWGAAGEERAGAKKKKKGTTRQSELLLLPLHRSSSCRKSLLCLAGLLPSLPSRGLGCSKGKALCPVRCHAGPRRVYLELGRPAVNNQAGSRASFSFWRNTSCPG